MWAGGSSCISGGAYPAVWENPHVLLEAPPALWVGGLPSPSGEHLLLCGWENSHPLLGVPPMGAGGLPYSHEEHPLVWLGGRPPCSPGEHLL